MYFSMAFLLPRFIKKKRKINYLSIVIPNLWYVHPWGYAADLLGVSENNIGNGGKHQKKKS
jgi:hypothetical protein